MSIEINLDTLPAYLRGEGFPDQAEDIEAASRDADRLIAALNAAAGIIPEGTEAHLAVTQLARVIRQANG